VGAEESAFVASYFAAVLQNKNMHINIAISRLTIFTFIGKH